MAGFTESFDGGLGAFGHKWGDIDTSTSGQITLTSHEGQWETLGAMMRPSGRDSGFGYGTFEFTISATNAVGPYALLWPGDDVWPGAEIDVFENNYSSGDPYSVVHHRTDTGGDGYEYAAMPGDIDTLDVHTYGVVWEPGQMTFTLSGIGFGFAHTIAERSIQPSACSANATRQGMPSNCLFMPGTGFFPQFALAAD